MEGLLKRRSVAKAHRYLWKSKVRIVQSIKQVSDSDVDRDSIICMLVLQALCEQVTLTTAGINTGTDVRTFVNMAIIWALVDLQILDPNSLDERERVIFDKSELFSGRYCKHRQFLYPRWIPIRDFDTTLILNISSKFQI